MQLCLLATAGTQARKWRLSRVVGADPAVSLGSFPPNLFSIEDYCCDMKPARDALERALPSHSSQLERLSDVEAPCPESVLQDRAVMSRLVN